MKFLKKIWAKLSGKKTIIGLGLHLAWFAANIAFKDLSTSSETITGHGLIFSITGVGIGHKVIKNKESIKKTIKDGKKRIFD